MSRVVNVGLWIVLAAIWSSSFSMIKIGVQTIDPVLLVSGRMVLAAILLYLAAWSFGTRLCADREALFAYSVTGILGNTLPYFLVSYGEQFVTSSLAAILMGATPITAVVIAHFVLTDEKMTLRPLIGVLVGFVGVVMLFGVDSLASIGDHLWGQLALTLAAMCYAAATVIVKRLPKRNPLELGAGAMIFGAVPICLWAVFNADFSNWTQSAPSGIFAMIYLGVLSTAVAMLIYFFLINRIEARQMTQINFAVPIGGALIGIAFLGESITPNQLLATPIIIFAIYLVTTKSVRARNMLPTD